MRKIAISVGDLNGIGIQLILENHEKISKMVQAIYCIDNDMLSQAADKLGLPIPKDFKTIERFAPYFDIEPGVVSKESGRYSYISFLEAVQLAKSKDVDAITTLSIHKKAWEIAGINYKGHTDALRDFFDSKAIMMLGCPQMYVALFTEHIPLRDVASKINEKDLTRFLVDFYNTAKPTSTVAVLGLNPHAGDDGVLGDEETVIQKAIDNASKILSENTIFGNQSHALFSKTLVPDVAFTPNVRKNYNHYVTMYHDQGLTALKALHFDEGINVSLNLPILRTSVDHGTAFDIAYKKMKLNNLSYLNAVKYTID